MLICVSPFIHPNLLRAVKIFIILAQIFKQSVRNKSAVREHAESNQRAIREQSEGNQSIKIRVNTVGA